jgi:hypothetical protein
MTGSTRSPSKTYSTPTPTPTTRPSSPPKAPARQKTAAAPGDTRTSGRSSPTPTTTNTKTCSSGSGSTTPATSTPPPSPPRPSTTNSLSAARAAKTPAGHSPLTQYPARRHRRGQAVADRERDPVAHRRAPPARHPGCERQRRVRAGAAHGAEPGDDASLLAAVRRCSVPTRRSRRGCSRTSPPARGRAVRGGQPRSGAGGSRARTRAALVVHPVIAFTHAVSTLPV